MQQDIVVVGTGGAARDLIETIEAINRLVRSWKILGFVDDNPELSGGQIYGYPVLGTSRCLVERAFQNVQVAIGVAQDQQLAIRKTIAERLRLPASRYPTIIHPSAMVSRRSQIGPGTIMLSGAFCSGNVTIGSHTVILQNTVIGPDSRIADFVTISANVTVGGGISIGEGAYIGPGALILPGIRIGDEARVAVGAVVVRDVAARTTVCGNPARVLRVDSARHGAYDDASVEGTHHGCTNHLDV